MINEFFKEKEFACKCGCGQAIINNKLVAILTSVREYFEAPVRITSGNRCRTYNAEVGGSARSQHIEGTAADIQVDGVAPSAVQNYISVLHKPGGLGRYGTFTHVDTREGAPARWQG